MMKLREINTEIDTLYTTLKDKINIEFVDRKAKAQDAFHLSW